MKYNDCCPIEISVAGEALDIFQQCNSPYEIKADIVVNDFQSVRIWGQLKDCKGCPVSRVLLKLIRCDCGKFSGVAHTISDCQGFYQFDLWDEYAEGAYKILVGRPVLCSGWDSRFSNPSCKDCESCQKSNQAAIRANSLNHCEFLESEDRSCKENALCRTCAYYDEETESCSLKDNL